MNKKKNRIFLLTVLISILSLACFCLPSSIAEKIIKSEPTLPVEPQVEIPMETVLAETPDLEPTPFPADPVSEVTLMRQWAVAAEASSEFGTGDWAASQAVGEPDVELCGDNGKAWASVSATTLEWIILDYATPVEPVEINIYQNYNPSQVVEVHGVDLEGYSYVLWQGEPRSVENCPDLMTVAIKLDEPILINQVVVVVDQSIMGWGWAEIDAVELVGYPGSSGESILVADEPQDNPPTQTESYAVPNNFSGWMSESVYQGYIQVVPGVTKVDELDGLLGLTGKRSTDSWKPRDDHADTFIYELGPKDMKAYIGVTTDGVVYKKSITPKTYPSDFTLSTVTKASYDQLDAIYKQDKVIPYADMANILGSPGFLREQYLRQDDGKMVATYQWYHANGDLMGGIFYDDQLTGMAGLVFIPKE